MGSGRTPHDSPRTLPLRTVSPHLCDANPTVGGDVTAILGIAIEPLSQIAPALPDPGITNGSGTVVAATRAADPGHLAEQVVESNTCSTLFRVLLRLGRWTSTR